MLGNRREGEHIRRKEILLVLAAVAGDLGETAVEDRLARAAHVNESAIEDDSVLLVAVEVLVEEVIDEAKNPEIDFIEIINPQGMVIGHNEHERVGQFIADKESLAVLKISNNIIRTSLCPFYIKFYCQ